MTDKVTNSLTDIQNCFESMSIMPNYENSEDNAYGCESELYTSQKDTSIIDCVTSSSSPKTSDSFLCLGKSEQFLNTFEVNVSNAKSSYLNKTVQELNNCSFKQLQILIEDLRHSVEEVSSELVQLLLENDDLQQESDARNIAIEQLLKMTVKINESDLKPIQMSVVLPDDDCDVA